jgi:hypothetical protein
MPEEFQSGALIDTRSDAEKLKDFKFEEIVTSVAPVNWVEKPQAQWRKFPIFNQDGSGSCVAQTLAKLLGILYWIKNGTYVHFSATHIYQRRANKPQGGMAGMNAFDIAREGVTLEELVPSQNMNDAQMDAADIAQYKKDVGSVFKVPNAITVPVKDIDTIASIIQQTGKGVMVWFYFKNDEWTSHPIVKYPNLDMYAQSTVRHSVTAVDFTLKNGKKCLVIDDSWGSSYGVAGQRTIDEDFFKARNFFAAYPVNFVFFNEEPLPVPVPAPSYTFSKVLEFGMTNPDVKALQDILKYEGLFPSNTASSGYYGAITAKGVLAWQKKHKVDSDDVLNQLAGRRVGEKTIIKLNSIY